MPMRVAIAIGQYPMGEPAPRQGIFVGRGASPLHALRDALCNALAFTSGMPAFGTRWAAANALALTLPDTIDDCPFAGEDHYNCRLMLHERGRCIDAAIQQEMNDGRTIR